MNQHRPIKADRENDYVLMELGRTLAAALDRSDEAKEGPDLFEKSLRHLPQLLKNATDGGFALGKGEAKLFRGQMRRKIRSASWKHLNNVAKQLDMTRPQVLRALMRIELGLSRQVESAEPK